MLAGLPVRLLCSYGSLLVSESLYAGHKQEDNLPRWNGACERTPILNQQGHGTQSFYLFDRIARKAGSSVG